MRQETSKRAVGGRGFLALAVAVAVGAVALIRAEPARANNDFQNGFEDQLGRIAAYQVAAFGVRVFGGAYYPPVVVAPVVVPVPHYYAPPVVYAPVYYARPHKLKVRQVVYVRGRPRYPHGGGYPSHAYGYRDARYGH